MSSGTGIKGYTGSSLYGGNYNISNGIIQSGAAGNGSSVSTGNISDATRRLGQTLSDAVPYEVSMPVAQKVAAHAGTDTSDYGDYIREMLDVSANNTAQSQAFAREQMDFQRESDATAMAWSASEAQKNRDWQERLADTAHQREVKDLLAAGLNPILSANAGAYTGSGATGQGFSSSGAMGSVDTAGSSMVGQLYSSLINTASQAVIAGMYTDAERYASDMNYASSKLAAEASIYNNNNMVSANKAITQMNNMADIQKANINAGATIGAAGMSAGAMQYSADMGYKSAQLNAETQKWLNEHNIHSNPLGTIVNWLSDVTGYDINQYSSDYIQKSESRQGVLGGSRQKTYVEGKPNQRK